MSDVVQITLRQGSAAEKWGKALFTPVNDGFQIHLNNQDSLRNVQKAGRSLDSFGLTEVTLTGELWTQELQWAFYQGFCSAKKSGIVHFCGDDSTKMQLEYLARCFSWAKKVTNQSPDDLYPEQLAKSALAFIESVAAKGTVRSEILLDQQLLDAGWNGLHAVGHIARCNGYPTCKGW